MHITTKFSCGDKAWAYNDRPVLLTIGQVRVEVTQSNGDPDTVFDNYKPQAGYVESYMCEESGIRSGTVYTLGQHIFETREGCIAANAERIAEQERAAAERKQWELRNLLASEPELRRQLARIEAAKAEGAGTLHRVAS